MNKPICLVLITLLISSCAKKDLKVDETKLKGVWSGLLFQTEAKFDSITLQPVVKPEKATLYKNGKETSYPLNKEGNYLSIGPVEGLRFDATYTKDSPNLYGVITNDLWCQSLTFTKSNNKWVANIQKPEIIDTDYTVYLEFYEDSLGILQAKIQPVS